MFAPISLLFLLALGPALIRPAMAEAQLGAPLTGATFTVDTGNDSNAADNELSLHEALNTILFVKNCFTDHEKNLISGVTWIPDTFLTCGEGPGVSRWLIFNSEFFPAMIRFSSNVGDVTLTGALPIIYSMTTIDGATSAGKVRLTRSGGYVGPGLTIAGCAGCSHDVYIHNLKIQGFTGDGITNITNGLTDSNFQGLEIYDNGGNGIYLSYGFDSNAIYLNPRTIIIGGPTSAERNLIYHNGGRGIFINGTTLVDWTDFNMLIQGNLIGMDAAGTPHGNGSDGILLNNARGVIVGGGTSAYANTVVHNYGDGVKLAGASTNNLVSNNFIGAESGGPSDRGNTGTGVTLLGGPNNNTVSSNLISGNNGVAGIYISGSGTNANSILQNTIGLGVTSALGNSGDGVLITGLAAGNVLNGNGIGWNGQNGVHLGGGATLNQLYSNYIGVNGAFIIGNVLNGVLIDGGAQHNQVGAAAAGNYIGGNGNDGVNIQGPGTASNSVLANLIGQSDTGVKRPNNSGVAILNGASNNTIGAAGAGNTIVSNNSAGVFIADLNTNNNYVYANYIGTNELSASGLGNASDGLTVSNGAANITIGTNFDAANRNVISGNGGNGVLISGSGTNIVTVAGNLIGIGVNAATAQVLPNGLAGIAVMGSTNVSIGGEAGSTVFQCISSNTRQGIYAQGTQQLKIREAQFIGKECFTVLTGVGNGMEGILLDNTQHSVVTPYLVSYNGAAGIAVTGANSLANTLHPAIDFGNGGLAIDLGNNGFTPNDPGDLDTGPNGLLNYPEVNHVSGNTISGTACANCTIFTYRAVGNPTLPHGGASSAAPVGFTNANGVWSITLFGGLTPDNVTLQSCQAANCLVTLDANTSELSPLNLPPFPWKAYLPMIKR